MFPIIFGNGGNRTLINKWVVCAKRYSYNKSSCHSFCIFHCSSKIKYLMLLFWTYLKVPKKVSRKSSLTSKQFASFTIIPFFFIIIKSFWENKGLFINFSYLKISLQCKIGLFPDSFQSSSMNKIIKTSFNICWNLS